jgi:hypothetical protein
MKKKPSIVTTTAAEDAANASRVPASISRELFEKWMDGLASEIVSGGALALDPESKAWNSATFRAERVVKSYKEGRGLFQYEDLS